MACDGSAPDSASCLFFLQALIGLGGSGAKTNWTRKMIPVGKATFQTIMGAIGR